MEKYKCEDACISECDLLHGPAKETISNECVLGLTV